MNIIQLETFSFSDIYYHSHGLVSVKAKEGELEKLVCKLNLFTPQGIQPIALSGDDLEETIHIYLTILTQMGTTPHPDLHKKLMEKYSH